MRKPHGVSPHAGVPTPTYVRSELGEAAELWFVIGGWSAYGVYASAQARPITVVNDVVFYLQTPQPWVTQELFTDVDVLAHDDLYGKA